MQKTFASPQIQEECEEMVTNIHKLHKEIAENTISLEQAFSLQNTNPKLAMRDEKTLGKMTSTKMLKTKTQTLMKEHGPRKPGDKQHRS